MLFQRALAQSEMQTKKLFFDGIYFPKEMCKISPFLFCFNMQWFFFQTQRYVRIYNLLKQELVKKLMTNVKWVSSMAIHPGGQLTNFLFYKIFFFFFS